MSKIEFTDDGDFTYHILMDEKIVNNEIKYIYTIWTNGQPIQENGKKWETTNFDEAKLILFQHKLQRLLNLSRQVRDKVHSLKRECERVRFQIHYRRKRLGLI